MNNALLYGLCVLIWGSTWIGIKYQLGVVDPMASVGHRFALSAVLIFVLLLLRRTPLKYPWRDHRLMLGQGLCLFCINYYFVYHAELVLTSGLVAVVFSNIMVMNIFNGALFLRAPINPRVLLGGGFGLLGMVAGFVLVLGFWRSMTPARRNETFPYALALALVLFPFNSHFALYGTYMSSLIWILFGLWAACIDNTPPKP